MKLLIPPPIVAMFFAAVVWLLNLVFPSFGIEFSGQTPLAILCAIMGFAVAILAARTFKKAGTQIDPRDPEKSSEIVKSGVFGISRNPMYLGLLLVLSGWVIWIGNFSGVAALAVFVWYITCFQIIPEEEILATKFGKEFDDYLLMVRRWI